MQSDNPLDRPANLETAIDYQPLILSPEQSVRLAVQQMSDRINQNSNSSDTQKRAVVSSCGLVVENERLVGIFTERDLVRLAANGSDLDTLTIGDVMTNKVITFPLNGLQDVFGALFLFRRYQVRHLPIIGDRGEIIGVISSESLRRVIRPADFLKLRRVGEVMTTPVICAPLQSTLTEVAQLMSTQRVSCVVIVELRQVYGNDAYDFPVGIITERDLVQFQSCYVDFHNTTADLVMSTPLLLLSPEDSLWTAHQEMQRLRVRRLVVSWDWGKGIGIVTLSNLLRLLDPVEMHLTKEVVTEAVGQSSPIRGQVDSTNLSQIKQNSQIKQQLRQLTEEISTHLLNTAQNRDTSNLNRNVEIANALTKIKRLQALIDNFDPPDRPISGSKTGQNPKPDGYRSPELSSHPPVEDESPQAVNSKY